MSTARRAPRSVLALGAIACLALAGCASGAADADATADTAGAAEDSDEDSNGSADESTERLAPLGGGDALGGGGVSGLVAAVSDALMQVQESDSQTAVAWTDDTVITRTVTVGLDSVAVGSCVVAITPAADEGSTQTAVATRVTVSDPVDGECSAGSGSWPGGGLSGGPPEGMELPEGVEPPEGMDRPEGGEMPEDGEFPEGMEPPGGMADAFGQMVAGRVTAVAGATLTVETTDADGGTTTATVGTDAGTVVTATVATDASAIAVGLCAAVRGETDDRGGMTAAEITLSDAGEDGCAARMGGMRTPPAADGGDDD